MKLASGRLRLRPDDGLISPTQMICLQVKTGNSSCSLGFILQESGSSLKEILPSGAGCDLIRGFANWQKFHPCPTPAEGVRHGFGNNDRELPGGIDAPQAHGTERCRTWRRRLIAPAGIRRGRRRFKFTVPADPWLPTLRDRIRPLTGSASMACSTAPSGHHGAG